MTTGRLCANYAPLRRLCCRNHLFLGNITTPSVPSNSGEDASKSTDPLDSGQSGHNIYTTWRSNNSSDDGWLRHCIPSISAAHLLAASLPQGAPQQPTAMQEWRTSGNHTSEARPGANPCSEWRQDLFSTYARNHASTKFLWGQFEGADFIQVVR